jgi:transcriptional regulator with XRE-family HTH domain
MSKSLGTRIRELREERDLSLREFAKKLDAISPAHVSDIELGRRFPSDELLVKMARILAVPLSELKSLDLRPRMEELKRLVESNPVYGMALRKLADKEISPEDLLKLIKKSDRDTKK